MAGLEKERGFQLPLPSVGVGSHQRGQLGSLEDPRCKGLRGWEEGALQPESCGRGTVSGLHLFQLCYSPCLARPSREDRSSPGIPPVSNESVIVQRVPTGQTSPYLLSLAVFSATASYSWPGGFSSCFVCFLLAMELCCWKRKCQWCLAVYPT